MTRALSGSRNSGRPILRRTEFRIDRRAPWIDTFLVALVFAAILFNLVIGPLTVLIVAGVVGLITLLRWERLTEVLGQSWILLPFPMFAMLSAIWSDVPYTSLRYGLLYTITAIAGILIGGGLDRRAYVNGYFAAFALYSVASILLGRYVPWGDGPGDAFAGLAGSKNTSGDMAGVAILTTVVFLRAMLDHKRFVWASMAVALMPILVFMLWASRATGALIATVLAVGCLIAWISSRRFARQVRGGIFLGIIVVTTVALVTQSWWLGPVFDLVLDASGKDAGLTGRTELWAFGNQLIAEKPLLGLGYNAFWLQDSIDAQYLWDKMGIASRQGFNFHSSQMEITIHLGYTGLILALVTFVCGSALLIMRSMAAPRLSSILACSLLLFFAVKMPFEVVAFGPMHFTTVTIFALLAAGLRKDGTAITHYSRPRRIPSGGQRRI